MKNYAVQWGTFQILQKYRSGEQRSSLPLHGSCNLSLDVLYLWVWGTLPSLSYFISGIGRYNRALGCIKMYDKAGISITPLTTFVCLCVCVCEALVNAKLWGQRCQYPKSLSFWGQFLVPIR